MDDKRLSIYNMATQCGVAHISRAHGGDVSCVAFSDTCLFSGGQDGKICVWDAVR
jgi:WD40 repeat protein